MLRMLKRALPAPVKELLKANALVELLRKGFLYDALLAEKAQQGASHPAKASGGAADRLYVPLGHYYSPIPGDEDVRRWPNPCASTSTQTLPGVDIRSMEQLELLSSFGAFYAELPFEDTPSEDRRFYFKNNLFSYADAIALYSMMRWLRPKRVIEIGSGFSSAVALDTSDLFLDSAVQFTFVEPYPARLRKLLRPGDSERCTILETRVQEVPLHLFDALESGDILFIDSTHVCRLDSDVNREIFEILPRLAKGVHVHFHDIFYPFDYPKSWIVEERRFWTEAYLLRAFLQYNDAFRVVFFNDYLGRFHAERVAEVLPLFLRNTGGSLWLRKDA